MPFTRSKWSNIKITTLAGRAKAGGEEKQP